MITKQTVVDQITITENCTILMRETTRIEEDGAILSTTFHRTTICPGDDVSSFSDQIKNIAAVVWTPEVIENFKSQQQQQQPQI